MGTNYYKACKCCGHHKVHLGKTSAGEKGIILLSNFGNKEAVLDVAKTKENEEIVDEGESKITFDEFRKKILRCVSFEKIEGKFC